MLYHIAADSVVVLHFVFICFVVAGGFIVLKWRWLVLLHLPAVVWGILIEFKGWICPLTPLEIYFRHSAGIAGYSGGFIEHYLIPVIYPAGLTRELQVVFGSLVIIINLILYVWFCLRLKKEQKKKRP